MSTTRKLQPPRSRSLADEVLELASRIDDGPGDVELPCHNWNTLVRMAEGEIATRAEGSWSDAVELAALRKFREDVRKLANAPEHSSIDRLLTHVEAWKAVVDDVSAKQVEALTVEKFEPIPPPKKKRARKHKAFCGVCATTTPHNGDDECIPCQKEREEAEFNAELRADWEAECKDAQACADGKCSVCTPPSSPTSGEELPF